MVIKTLFKLEAGKFDIETACLQGERKENLWIDIPSLVLMNTTNK
jgi:hypothetical protein